MADDAVAGREARVRGLLAAAGVVVDDSVLGQLDAVLEQARAAWPDAMLDEDAMVSFIAPRIEAGRLPIAAAADLALAAAAQAHAPWALSAFEREVISRLGPALGRKHAPEIVAEVQQRLRVQLLTRPEGLSAWSGRGPLGAWVRVLAVREAQRARQEVGDCDDGATELVAGLWADPERTLLRETTREVVKDALRGALAQLEPRQRTLLRYHYVDRLGIDRIAPLFGVHRASVARWLDEARTALLSGSRRSLEGRFDVGADGLPSILGALQSELHVSLSQILIAAG